MKQKTQLAKTALALLMAGAVLTACSNDEDTPVQNKMEAGKTYNLSVNATKGSTQNNESAARGTRALSSGEAGINATWATTEKVYVKYDNSWFTGELSPNANAATAHLNGTISGVEVSLPNYLTLQFPRKNISYKGQVGTLADIAANFDYATATAHVNIENSDITATSADTVTFRNLQAIVKFTLNDAVGNALNVSWLRVSATNLEQTDSETGDITITPSSATNELFAALSGISDTKVMLTAKAGDKYYVFVKSGVTFDNSSYHEVAVNMQEIEYPVDLSTVTKTRYIGSVVGADGKVYPNATAATVAETTAIAMIAYVGSESNCKHGLAIALTDESGTMNQETARSAATAQAHTAITDATWRLPTLQDWQYMFIGCGNGEAYSQSPGEVNYTAFNAKLATVGTALKRDYYWSSIEDRCPYFNGRTADLSRTAQTSYDGCNVRLCLAW